MSCPGNVRIETIAMRLLLLILTLLFACCQSPPTRGKLEMAQLGERPTPEKAKDRVRQYLAESLRDYDSAQIAFGEIRHGWYYPKRAMRYAWDLQVCVDDLNEFGMREGAQIYHFYFLGEELVAAAVPDRQWYGRSYRYRYRIEEFGDGGLTSSQAGFADYAYPYDDGDDM